MNRITNTVKDIAILTIAATAFFSGTVGCDKEPKEPVPSLPETEGADFFLADSCIEVPATGGNVKIVYILNNAADEYSIVPEYDADWLGGFDTEGQRSISFSIESNPDDTAREARVCLTYLAENDTISDILTVTQLGAVTVPEFEFDITGVTDHSISFSVIPEDKKMPYIVKLTEKSYIDAFGTDEQFIENELALFKAQAESQGMSMEEYLGMQLLTGNIDSVEVSGLEPETEYCIYAHGLDVEGNVLTGLYKNYVSTVATELVDISFEITADIYGTTVTIGIKPSDLEQKYMFDAFKTRSVPDGYTLEEFFQEYVDEQIAFYAQLGISAESIIAQISHTGNASSKAELEAETDYVCIAVSVNDIGTVNSAAGSEYFTTGEVLPSENIIEIDVTETKERSAAFTFMPSNDDPYIFIVDKAENWANLTNDKMAEKLLSVAGNNPDRFTGEHSDIAENLLPGTEYVIIAAGWVQGTITTEPFIEYFTTLTATVSDVTFRLLYDKYFDCDELAASHPEYSGLSGFVAVPAKAETAGNVSKYMYHMFRGNLMDSLEFTDDMAIDTLMHRNITDTPEIVFNAMYDIEYTFLGVAIDTNGNYGKVFRGKLSPVRDGVSPVEEFE